MAKRLSDVGISFARKAMPMDSYVTIHKVSFSYSEKFETDTAEIDGAITNADGSNPTDMQMFTTSGIVIKQLKDIMSRLGYEQNKEWDVPITVFTKSVVGEKGRTYITLE